MSIHASSANSFMFVIGGVNICCQQVLKMKCVKFVQHFNETLDIWEEKFQMLGVNLVCCRLCLFVT